MKNVILAGLVTWLAASCCLTGPRVQPTQTPEDDPTLKERAEEFRRKAQSTWRERDASAYLTYVIDTLRLAELLEEYLKREEAIEGYRMYALDSFATPEEGTITARIDMLPKWTPILEEAVSAAFGPFAILIPKKLLDRISHDLAVNHRLGTFILDTGLDEAVLHVSVTTPDGDIELGSGVTDGTGRTVIDVDPELLTDVPSGAWPLAVRLGHEELPQSWHEQLPIQHLDGARLYWRKPETEPVPVYVVNLTGVVFDLETPAAISLAARKGQYQLIDECVADGVAALRERGAQIVYLTGFPEGVSPFIRRELQRTGVSGGAEPIIAAPPMGEASFKAKALTGLSRYFGDGQVRAYIADAKKDAKAADAAGIELRIVDRKRGGWCEADAP